MCFVYRLVFSQSLLSLDLIEAFLAHWDKQIPHADDQVCVGLLLTKTVRHFTKVRVNYVEITQ